MLRLGLTFDDVLLVPQYSGIRSRQDVTTESLLGAQRFAIPVLSANMDTITGSAMASRLAALGGLGVLHRFQSIEANVAMLGATGDPARIGVSVGVGPTGLARSEALIAAGARFVCVDVAHAHFKPVNRTIRALRERFGASIVIIAGNVATAAGADYLAAAGADAIKVGIGPGSACTTRLKTGFGVPQLSAIVDCRSVGLPLIADGGIRNPADAVKALAAGADFVMLGGMLAGTDEAPGDVIERPGPDGAPLRVKHFRGMASQQAQEDHRGAMDDWKTAEGVAMEVPCRGPVDAVIRDLVGGIRSGLTYAGASTIKELQRKAEFIRVTPAANAEGHAHALDRLSEPRPEGSGRFASTRGSS